MALGVQSPREPLDAEAFFDLEAARYDRAHDDAGMNGQALRSRLALAVRMLGDGPGDVLDAGMGPGRLLSELAARGWRVSGVDLSEAMVAHARRRIPEASRRLQTGSIEQLPADDGTFDAVTATGVLEYSADLSAALSEIHRVLRPGGRALVSVPNPRAVYARWYRRVALPVGRLARRVRGGPTERPAGQGAITRRRFEALMAEAGFEVEAVAYTGFHVLPAPLDRMFPRTAARAARALDGSGAALGRVLGTQVVFAARSPAPGGSSG